jgi:superfamily II DNA or RNA helicase
VPLRPVGEGAAVSELREGGADAEVAAALMARLREVRGRLAQDVLPRPRSERAVDRVRVLARNPPQYAVAERTDDGEGLTVHVPITLDPAFDVRPVCSACSQACVHALDAVDDVLALLADELHPRRDELLGAAAQAPWRRWLGALDEALAELEADTARRRAARLWWSVDLAKEELAPHVEEQAQRGGFLKPKRVRLEEVESLVDLRAEDRAALAAVRLMRAERRVATRDGRVQALFHRTLESLVGHPRVSLGAPGGVPWRVEAAPVRFAVERRDDALDLRVHVGPIELEPKDLLGGAPRARTMLFPAPAERVLRIAHIEAPLAKLLARWASLAVPVPADAQAALMQRLSRAAEHVPVQAADLIREVKVEPRLDLVALLSPLPQGGLQIELRARPLPDGPLFRPGLGPEDVLTSTPERQILRTTRDLWAERGAATDLWAALALVPDADDPDLVVVEPLADALEAVERLRHHPGLECQWPQQPWYPATSVGVERLRLSVRTKRDWLGLYGGVEVSGKRMELAVLVEAARRDRGYVALDDGQFLQLEAALAGRLRELAPYLEPKQGGLRISPAAAELVRALGDDAYRFEAEQAWSELLARMDAAAHLAPEVPAHLQDVLRPYQAEGFVWMSRLAAWGAGAVLADDMGLGKTVQAIAMLSTRAEEGPQLVVAPTSVGFNWARELARFAPQLTVVSYAGPDREVKLQRARPGAVFITSYGVVQRDAATLAPWPWATVVLDEAQAIKNPKTRRARAVRSLTAAGPWTLALTGTPVENHPADLWALFEAVFPGLLGTWESFRVRFIATADEDGKAFGTAALAKVVRPYVLRRTKAQVAQHLPPRTEVTVDVSLSHRERALYEDARLAAIADLEETDAVEQTRYHLKVFAALTRLRQLACHPRLVDPRSRVPSSKLERVVQVVEDLVAEGRRALMFSQFVQHLSLVREALDARGVPYAYLDGSTPTPQRAAAVDRFQQGGLPLFLISLKAGGTGLNLTAADTVLHLDPWWNPAVEDQATDRAHRLGQALPVTVMRFVARDTIEAMMLDMNREKRALFSELLDGTEQAGKLSAAELMALIRA